ncbi:MAG: transposase family protein, partial [Streptosporangiaceae bacterium]
MPAQSRMPVPAAAEEALGELAAHAASLRAASGGRLLECFAMITDPRDPRGIRHSLPSVLALCTAAALCGNTGIEDVTAWVAAAPQRVLAAAGCRRDAAGMCVPPHPDTIVRVFTALGAQALADHAGMVLACQPDAAPVTFPVAGPGWLPAVAVDGKAVRGAAGEDGQIPYLLAAATHATTAVLAETLIGPKTNEVPELAPLLRRLNEYYPLAGHVITVDAGHTVRAHAAVICGELLAHYVMTVKRNTPGLYDALDALDWASVPVQHVTEEKGHGRRERRTIQV